jgi:hypothetical protein
MAHRDIIGREGEIFESEEITGYVATVRRPEKAFHLHLKRFFNLICS